MSQYDEVLVRVMANVDSLRRGDEGEVELTPHIQALVNAGYVKILGHVRVPVLAEPLAKPVAEPMLVEAPPAKPPRRSHRKPPGVVDGDSEGTPGA